MWMNGKMDDWMVSGCVVPPGTLVQQQVALRHRESSEMTLVVTSAAVSFGGGSDCCMVSI